MKLPKTPEPQQIFNESHNFDYNFLRNKLEKIHTQIIGTAAATAANYGVFFHATKNGYIEEVWESHKVAGSDGGTVTVDIERLSSGQALDAGSAMLASALSLKTTANTPQQGTISSDITKRQFVKGDRLALKDTGTLTAVSGVVVTIVIRYTL